MTAVATLIGATASVLCACAALVSLCGRRYGRKRYEELLNFREYIATEIDDLVGDGGSGDSGFTSWDLKKADLQLKAAEIAIAASSPRGAFRALNAQRRDPSSDIPSWALGFMSHDDAKRYEWEWGAHLRQLIEEGEARQARRDRRRLIVAAVTLAVVLRVRRALGRAR